MRKALATRALVMVLAGLAAGTAQAQVEPTRDLIQALVRELGFTQEDQDRVRAGGIASRAQSEDENELAAALLVVIKQPVDVIYEEVESNDVFRIDRSIMKMLPIDPLDPAAAFRDFELPSSQVEELQNASPGSKLNLSKDEIEKLRAAPKPETLAVYRSQLAARVEAYASGGLSAIAPYARKGENAEPGHELRSATKRLAHLETEAPSFARVLLEFPKPSAQTVEHQFWWQLLEVEKKPTPVLIHRAFEQRDHYALLATRQFYVARSYNSLQVVVGVFALDAERSLVVYTNRTFTDQVAGFGSSARHRIGRGMLVDEVSTFFEALRKEVESL